MTKLNIVWVGTIGWWLVACGGTVDLEQDPLSVGGTGGSSLSTPNGGGNDGPVAGAPSEEPGTFADACQHYCEAYVPTCPDAGYPSVATCVDDCTGGLEFASPACVEGKRVAYECIAGALLQEATSCPSALSHAEQTCGSADAEVPACHEKCLPEIHGGNGFAQADATCDGDSVTLRCEDALGGGTPCTCSINGAQTFELASGFDDAKSAVTDDGLFQLCLSSL